MNIQKIAELAGVSVATVSRVFNHPEKVLPETRERIIAVMEEHNFTPNWFARGLTIGTSKTIALLVPAIVSNLYQNIISGVETVAGNKGYAVIFGQTRGDWETEYNFLKLMKDRKVDGVIHVGPRFVQGSSLESLSLDMPCVHIGRSENCDCKVHCYFDTDKAAHRLLHHLTELGNRSFSLIYDSKQDGEIAVAFENALQTLSPKSGEKNHFKSYEAEDSTEGGYLALQRIIKQDSLPDVLLTGGDLQAIGALKAARDSELRIPEDLALASFNDSPVCSVVSPALTCVEMPAAKLGMTAARLLFDSIENDDEESDYSQELILQPKLKIRESCGNKTDIFELFD
ncbi:MAG TPA: LacI family transcriptional regulator [Fastidiosipila sp.]|nr:LacI family transcriptional regulator [Fastidiosipila sp.]